MEDSKSALFVEPNAYINYFKKKDNCEIKPIKKVVFSEPYDCMPTFHIKNDFQKGCCDCVANSRNDCNLKHLHNDFDCNQNHNCNSNHNRPNFNFDIKNLMPILSGMNKNGSGFDFNSISSLLSNSGNGFDFSKLLSNPELIKTALSLFSGKKRVTKPKEEIVCTDYEINRYTKV